MCGADIVAPDPIDLDREYKIALDIGHGQSPRRTLHI
jgi:hypothetical protein